MKLPINKDFKWSYLQNVEYLTHGTNCSIHTAIMNGKPVVVKTLKQEFQDLAVAINELEDELIIHSKLHHPNIVQIFGAGTTSKGNRFLVLERLDGGSLTQALGYNTHIRDHRRRFWKRKHFSYNQVLHFAMSLAKALSYCHKDAIAGNMILHRDLKPDNIGFTLDGTLKIMDFGLAEIVENASPFSNEVYQMSGETGSLRYMAPEVAEGKPYNHKADVYSFGIILWELLAFKKPYEGLNRDSFYERVVHRGGRPPIDKKWPKELANLMNECWSVDIEQRPCFHDIVNLLDNLIHNNIPSHHSGHNLPSITSSSSKKTNVLTAIIDRHCIW